MAKRNRAKQVVFRLSEEEYEKFKAKVEQSGMKQQEYILNAVLNKPIVNTDGLKEIIPELKRQGANINQIAKQLNGKGYYDYNLITENQKELREIWQLLKQFPPKQV